MVEQEIKLYGCSVRDNLTLWRPDISDDLIRYACDQAYILEDILKLPDGFDTILSEGLGNIMQ